MCNPGARDDARLLSGDDGPSVEAVFAFAFGISTTAVLIVMTFALAYAIRHATTSRWRAVSALAWFIVAPSLIAGATWVLMVPLLWLSEFDCGVTPWCDGWIRRTMREHGVALE